MADFTYKFKQRGRGIGLLILAIFELIMAAAGVFMLYMVLSGDFNIEFEYGPIGALVMLGFVLFLLVGGLIQVYAGIIALIHPKLDFTLSGKNFHAYKSIMALTYNGGKALDFDLANCDLDVKIKNGTSIYTLKNPQGKCTFTDGTFKDNIKDLREAWKK